MASLLASVEHGPGADEAQVNELQITHTWLPLEYLDCLRWSDGLEGHVGGRGYLRLWSARSAQHFNRAYCLPEFLPSAFMFGTDAAAVGYGFDQRNPGRVFSVELAALDDEYLSEVATSFESFVLGLAAPDSSEDPVEDHRPPAWLRGHVLHEKHPIALGGPVDAPNNRALIPEQEHPALAVFWTRTIRAVRSRIATSQQDH